MTDVEVDDFLEHFGVKGMKWGVVKSEVSGYNSRRKSRYSEIRNSELSTLTVNTKHGKTVTVDETRSTKLAAFIGSLSSKNLESSKNYKTFSFSVDGKKVGDASFNWNSKDELNLVWLGVNSKQRGKGYGSAVFESSIAYAKTNGAKRVTLEVPGNAPDAKHIYEKVGFTSGKQISPSGDIWGGLTEMSLDLTKSSSLSHSDISQEEIEVESAIMATFTQLTPEIEDELNHADEVDDFLEHFGVLGMHWGQHKAPSSSKLAYMTAKTDRKDLKALTKTSYRGVAADRKAVRDKIKERAKSDPEYRAALKKVDKRSQAAAMAVVLSSSVGIAVAPLIIMKYGDTIVESGIRGASKASSGFIRGASNASKSYSESHFASMVRRGTKYNPKSPFWDGVNIAGSVVNMSAELVRRYP